jgi:hypothetical protein
VKQIWLFVLFVFLVLTPGQAPGQEPPDSFTGTAPVDNGSLVSLKDGRLMMVGSGTRVSYSKDGGRSWVPSQPLAVKGKPLAGNGDPTSVTASSETGNSPACDSVAALERPALSWSRRTAGRGSLRGQTAARPGPDSRVAGLLQVPGPAGCGHVRCRSLRPAASSTRVLASLSDEATWRRRVCKRSWSWPTSSRFGTIHTPDAHDACRLAVTDTA